MDSPFSKIQKREKKYNECFLRTVREGIQPPHLKSPGFIKVIVNVSTQKRKEQKKKEHSEGIVQDQMDYHSSLQCIGVLEIDFFAKSK